MELGRPEMIVGHQVNPNHLLPGTPSRVASASQKQTLVNTEHGGVVGLYQQSKVLIVGFNYFL